MPSPSVTKIVSRPIAQHEPLTVRLRNLVEGYPKGFGILKEFLQNADDAGASAVEVVMDWRAHPTSGLPTPGLTRLCGPALLIINDAVFTDPDFDSILALGASGKRLDSTKIGKFGLGFNAAYNVTDHPCMVSRDRLYILDPHRSAVAELSDREGVALTLNSALWEEGPSLLRPFAAGGLAERTIDFGKTIFRLPLRTHESAADSEISKEAFTYSDFQAILSQAESRAPELLLFLQNVLTLRVSEIPAEGGAPRELLRVETENREEVTTARSVVGRWLGGTQAEVLASLREAAAADLCSRYEHRVSVESSSSVMVTRWFVVNGLHTGPHCELLDLADAILHEGDRALPLAGAAARLEVTESGQLRALAVDGRVFCGLPLPRETPLKIHLNGFFELDGNRDWLKGNTESVGSHEAHRRQWNQALVRHGAAAATVMLLDALAGLVGPDGLEELYSLWPDDNAGLASQLPGYGAAVYSAAWSSESQLVRVQNPSAAGAKPRDVILLPDEWHDALAAPLSASGWRVPCPPLPIHIVHGFKAASRALSELAPSGLRARWRTDKDINVALADAPEPAWRNSEWVAALLRFVLSDGKRDLKGVPLALLSDSKLHTFGHSVGNITYIATAAQQEIFAKNPHWFIDPEFVERCGLDEIPEANVRRMTPADVLRNLNKFLKTDQDAVAWDPVSDGPPNGPWLASVFRYLATARALATEDNCDAFAKLALVPDQFGRLNRPGTTTTPFWPVADKELRARLRQVLGALKVPLVKGPVGITAALRSAVAPVVEDPLICEVTGPYLVETISETIEEWDETARRYDPGLHDVLLDFLASHAGSGYSDDQVKALRSLPIFPTTSRKLVALADSEVLLPADTHFPAPPGTLLLKTGSVVPWRGLLKRLGVRSLSHLSLTERILEAEFSRLSGERQHRLLLWLRTNLDRVLTEASSNREALLGRLRAAKLIRGDDRRLHAASELYDRSANFAREVLGPVAVFADFEGDYAVDADLWESFFRRLGTASELRPEHLIAHVDQLVAEARRVGAEAVADRLLRVFDHVREHWVDLATRNVRDPLSGVECTLQDALRARAWLPARRAPEALQNYPGYEVPDDRLYRASELYEAYQGHLVASRAPLARPGLALAREVREGLGFPGNPPLSLVLDHFEHLLDLWERPGHGGLRTERLDASLSAIYRAIGNALAAAGRGEGAADGPALAGLRDRFEERACLWNDATRTFWLPRHAFAEPVHFFGDARSTLVHTELTVNAAYNALGRRATVEVEDLAEFLRELARTHAGTALPESERTLAAQVLLRLAAEQRREGAEIEPCPLLAVDGQLLDPSLLFEDDDPYHEPYLREACVPLVHAQVPLALSRAMGVASLAASVVERMAGEPRLAGDPALRDKCRRVAATVHSGEFIRGMRRLLRHRGQEHDGVDLSWLRRLEVVPTLPFEVELWLAGDPERRVATMEASFFFEPAAERVYVASDSADLVSDYLAQAINRRLGEALADLSPMLRMLDAAPAMIDALLTKLRITRLRDDAPVESWAEETGQEIDSPMTFGDASQEDDAHSESYVLEAPEAFESEDEVIGAVDEPSTEEAEWHDEESSGAITGDSARSVHRSTGLDTRTDAPSLRPSRTGSNGGDREPAAESRQPSLPPSRPRPRTFHAEALSASPPAGGDSTGAVLQRRGAEAAPRNDPGGGTSRSRVVTYVVSGTGPRDPQDPTDDDLPQNQVIGEAAEAFAADEEARAPGRRVRRMPRNNPGFDILSEDATGEDRRYIEVKGLRGEWSRAGVPLSARQFEMAWQERERFWLYVVEYALDPARRRVTRVQNPVGFLTEFRIDHYWRMLGT